MKTKTFYVRMDYPERIKIINPDKAKPFTKTVRGVDTEEEAMLESEKGSNAIALFCIMKPEHEQ